MGQNSSAERPTETAGLKGEYQMYQSLFSADEQEELRTVFESICEHGGSEKGSLPMFSEKQLKVYLSNKMSEELVTQLFNQLWLFQGTFSKPATTSIGYEAFIVTMAKLLKGTMEEISHMVCCLATDDCARISKADLCKFISEILSCYEKVLKVSDRMGGWRVEADAESKQRFVLYTIQGLEVDDESVLEPAHVQTWLEKSVVFYSLLTDVFQVSFHPSTSMQRTVSTASAAAYVDEAETITEDILHHVPRLPTCRDTPWSKVTTLLDLPALLTINYHLPHELRREWRFLYSSSIHGSSFSTFLAHIQHKGPSVLVVRDMEGRVFGGFVSESWSLGPNFRGNSHCFLFSLTPDLGIYESTGHNDHFMYLNIDQQTMPNGLGMGGQLEYFGLWIDQDYGKGHSRAKPKCTTFDSPQLSASEDFTIDCLEVWAVGPLPKKKPEDEEEEGAKSILDKDPEATALLELAGRTRKSEGLRTVEDDPTADIPEVHSLPPLS